MMFLKNTLKRRILKRIPFHSSLLENQLRFQFGTVFPKRQLLENQIRFQFGACPSKEQVMESKAALSTAAAPMNHHHQNLNLNLEWSYLPNLKENNVTVCKMLWTYERNLYGVKFL
jgi:hypothetical protein